MYKSLVHLVGIIYQNIITMHGPLNIKQETYCKNSSLISIIYEVYKKAVKYY